MPLNRFVIMPGLKHNDGASHYSSDTGPYNTMFDACSYLAQHCC